LEAVLLRIANTLILNTGKVDSIGLLDGKMGIALFLYHYSQINGNKVYRNFADELLGEILRWITNKNPTSVSFLYGLTGIAWGIHHLIVNKFVDADEDALEEVDTLLKNISHSDILTDIENECPLYSKGIYFMAKNDKEVINNVLQVLSQSLSQNIKVLPLSYFNSILYMILHGNHPLENLTDLLKILYTSMMDSIKNKRYTFPDVILLTHIIERLKEIQDVTVDCEKWETLLKILDYDDLTGIFNTGIYDLIFTKMKNNNSFILSKLETMDIENQIDSMIKDVYRNLNLYNGLAGAGLTVKDFLLQI